MIGSHNTFTYLDSTCPLFNLGKRWWKCQSRSIGEQYGFGVRMFDIRVCWDKDRWRNCHGAVNLQGWFFSLESICQYMAAFFPDAIYRIVLEKGEREHFLGQIAYTGTGYSLTETHPNLWRLDIKAEKYWLGRYGNNNEQLYERGYKFAMGNTWESPAHELTGHVTTGNFYRTSLRREAKRINSRLPFFQSKEELRQMTESKEQLYFIDYATNEY